MKKIVFVIMVFAFGLMAHDYVGAKKCKSCHNSKKKANLQQYKVWEKAKHSKAFEILSPEEQKNPECLKCHTTAYEITKGDPKFHGVQCEQCHGAGKNYKKKKVMKSRKLSKSKGLLFPNEKTCTVCHNDSHKHHKPFNFKEYTEKIKHWEGKVGDNK